MPFECATRTDVGLRRRINEDSLLALSERGLWAVADGMGGHDAGEVASGLVIGALDALPPAAGLEQLVDGAVDALLEVNQELVRLGAGRTIGSTVAGLAIVGDQYCCFWAGDSRVYRLRDGEFAQLTRDHSVVQGLVDAGMLEPHEAEQHPNANLITRAVGVGPELKVDRVSGETRPGDLYLLATDGLTRVVDDREMAAVLSANAPAAAADRLVEAVLARGAPDNVSLVIVRLD